MANPFLSCVHTHTHFCDGKDAPEVMVKRALELGFVSLGFSGHAPARWDPAAMTEEALEQYITEIRRLQQVYDGQLEILLGIERENDKHPLPEDVFEYSIESVHSLEIDGEPCYIDWSLEKMQAGVEKFFGGDIYSYAEAYFATCAKQYEKGKAQIAGHVDLLTKFNESAPLIDETNPRYRKALFEAIDTGLEKGLVFEVNSGAISRGYRTTPYPAPFILEYLLEKKAPVVVTGDCHDARYLDCHYEEIAELLQTIGFKSTLRLRKSGWEEIGL